MFGRTPLPVRRIRACTSNHRGEIEQAEIAFPDPWLKVNNKRYDNQMQVYR